jgi:hypothetical protein
MNERRPADGVKMFSQNHLHLGSIRLKSADEWSQKREGLSFLLVKQGGGKVVSGSSVHRVGSGDVLVVEGGGAAKVSVETGGDLELWGFSVSLEQLYPLFGAGEISRLQDVSEGFSRAKVFTEANC